MRGSPVPGARAALVCGPRTGFLESSAPSIWKIERRKRREGEPSSEVWCLTLQQAQSRILGTYMIRFAGFLTLVLVSAGALGQSGSFSVSQNGKPVGTAMFNLVPNQSGGFDSTSSVRVNMQGLNYAFSKTEVLSVSMDLVHVQLSATVNGSAVNSANGRRSTRQLAGHQQTAFLPDFDPGGLQSLLILGSKSNNRDLWAIIPKQAGSVESVQLAIYPDEEGTLNGSPVTVHHVVATIAGAITDLFSGPKNELLQAELPQDGFALVQNGFVLKPPTKAPAPPVPPAPKAQGPPAE